MPVVKGQEQISEVGTAGGQDELVHLDLPRLCGECGVRELVVLLGTAEAGHKVLLKQVPLETELALGQGKLSLQTVLLLLLLLLLLLFDPLLLLLQQMFFYGGRGECGGGSGRRWLLHGSRSSHCSCVKRRGSCGRGVGGAAAVRQHAGVHDGADADACLLYTSPSPRDRQKSRMPSSA